MTAQHMESHTGAAILRGMIKANIKRKKAEEYAKLIFETFGITNKNKFEKLMAALKDEANIQRLSEMAADSLVLYNFIEAFIGINSSKRHHLHILTSDIKTKVNGDATVIHYLERPGYSFDELEKDFQIADHLKFLSVLKRSREYISKIMFLCENIDTGLIAPKYILDPISAENLSCFGYSDEQVSFANKVILVSCEEIDSFLQGSPFGTESFFCGPVGFQGIQNKGEDNPWWLRDEDAPMAVIIKQKNHISSKFVNNLKWLGEKRQIYVIAEKGPDKAGKDEVDIHFGCDINGFLEEISFCLDYDVYEITEPDINSLYMQKIFIESAMARDFRIHEDVNIGEILEMLKKNRVKANAWEGNTSVQMLINKAISVSEKSNVKGLLRAVDFEFLKNGLLIINNRPAAKQSQNLAMDAWERMNNSIFGLEHVKKEMMDAMNTMTINRVRESFGLPASRINNVFAFYGPPGVGKTEMAKHFGEIMKEKGFLSSGRFININGAQLKGQYVGQTAPKIASIFAAHDIIFIDECYSLTASHNSMDTFSQEALAELCVQLEQHGKDKLIIFAGYGGDIDHKSNKMKEFLDANPGLASRITFHVEFPKYSAPEMLGIFQTMAENEKYQLEVGWEDLITTFVAERFQRETYGNARDARKLFQHVIKAQTYRISGLPYTIEILRSIKLTDIKEAIQKIQTGEQRIAGRIAVAIGF